MDKPYDPSCTQGKAPVLTITPTGGPLGAYVTGVDLRDTLVFFMWHESYHMGQLGTIRKQLGYAATAELATAASTGG